MATLHAASHFGLKRKGLLAPGFDADIVVVNGTRDLSAEMVFTAGRLVAREGSCCAPIPRHRRDETMGSVRMKPLAERDIELGARSDTARVIELIPGQIETKLAVLPPAVQDGSVVADRERDILKIVVIERHRATGNVGIGLVKGFGLKRGAIASTVAHDSHNAVAVGVDDRDIIAALSAIRTMDGGLVVVRNGRAIASLPLPVAGLMSGRPAAVVAGKLEQIDRAVRDLGSPLEHPFGVLSFLALPVVPELKITDRGLVDVGRHSLTELFV
jgi:adenine deaminase